MLALSAVQVLDRVFLDDTSHADYARTKRIFVWQILITLVHVLDGLGPYLQQDLQNRTQFKTTMDVLFSREGAKANWLLISLLTSLALTNAVTYAVKHKPLLLVATLALVNASAAYFVKSVTVDLTHFETLTTSYNFITLAHPLFIHAAYTVYGFSAFLCAIYKIAPKKRDLSAKLIDLASKLSVALLTWGAALGAYCNHSKGKCA